METNNPWPRRILFIWYSLNMLAVFGALYGMALFIHDELADRMVDNVSPSLAASFFLGHLIQSNYMDVKMTMYLKVRSLQANVKNKKGNNNKDDRTLTVIITCLEIATSIIMIPMVQFFNTNSAGNIDYSMVYNVFAWIGLAVGIVYVILIFMMELFSCFDTYGKIIPNTIKDTKKSINGFFGRGT